MQRRQFLVAGSALTATLVAGCTGAEGDGSSSGDSGSNGSGESENESGSGGDSEVDAQDALESDETESTVEGLEVLEHEFYEEDYSAGVEGVVANNTGEELGYVEVGVVFYNAEGQRIDDSFTNTTDLPDGSEWVFDVMFLGDDPGDVDDYSIAATDSPF